MGFRSASENVKHETLSRVRDYGKDLSFGVTYLDDCLKGIRPDDLVLIGAPSGAGKTQLCANIAKANISDGKKVHMFALEASEFEIERRIKFQILSDIFFKSADRPLLPTKFNYVDWIIGTYAGMLDEMEELADDFCERSLAHLFTFYKSGDFTVDDLIESIMQIYEETDLIIVDHVHYFDWDDRDDNRAIKEIAKNVRNVCLELRKPVILVAHLRKRDRWNKEICASQEEIHGSSDLYKIGTKIVTIAPGGPVEDGFVTYFRAAKGRNDNGVSRYLGQVIFNIRRRQYEDKYRIGWANSSEFKELELGQYPEWGINRKIGSNFDNVHQGKQISSEIKTGKESIRQYFNPSERD